MTVLAHRVQRYPEAPVLYHILINGVFNIRRLLLRYLALPRPDIFRKHWIQAGPDSRNGHYFLSDYLVHPWYVKPTLKRHWGPGAWIAGLFGYDVPGDEGEKYHPHGYTFADLGAKALRGQGVKEMDEIRAGLVRGNRGGCPFSPSKVTT